MKRVDTESGATYFLDLENDTMVRVAGSETPDLRKDGEAAMLLGYWNLEVGYCLELLIDLGIDGVDSTLRTTTPIVSITDV